MTVDHPCPVQWANDHGLLDGTPLSDRCCFSVLREVVEGIPTPDPRHPELLLWHEGAIEIFYTPFDWMNVSAKVMLVGITPGLYQATKALECAKACLAAQMSGNETLRQVDATGSFAGPMRRNLVTMLDGIGLAEALGLTTTERLFDSGHDLVDHASAISYPVFCWRRELRGKQPPTSILRSTARAWLGASVNMAEGALVIPLGTVATEAVESLSPRDCWIGGAAFWGYPIRRGRTAGERASTPNADAGYSRRWRPGRTAPKGRPSVHLECVLDRSPANAPTLGAPLSVEDGVGSRWGLRRSGGAPRARNSYPTRESRT